LQVNPELSDIYEEIAQVRREGGKAALATIVAGESGSPGKTGFQMLVYPDGRISGTVGGGILEAKIRDEALLCLKTKESKLLEFTLDQEGANATGSICGGTVKVFVQSIEANPTLYVFGTGHIALPLVNFAKALDYNVMIIDDREEFANKQRFPLADEIKLGDFTRMINAIEFRPDDHVVIITRGHEHDELVLKECLLKTNLPGYIGMIGSREKVATTLARLKEQGISEQLLVKVNSPIGLDIGAKTPAEIAISILAEIVAHRYGKLQRNKQMHLTKIDSTNRGKTD
jgi:xanthine dehydrogenase accessory factor